MAQTTEAACLLQSGSMYSRRIGWKTSKLEHVFAGIKPGGVSIYFDDAPIFHFDLEGRWQRAFIEGMHYLKGLDGTVRAIARDREAGGMVLRRETLPFAMASDLDATIRSVALGLIDDIDRDRLRPLAIPEKARGFAIEEFREFLERVAAWDTTAWFAHRERYLGTYGPIPFLPPDGPNPLVLQATLGDVGGRAFGGAEPAEHYVRSLTEFREHASDVALLSGRRLAQYRGVFLGGADLLKQPMSQILDILQVIGEIFPIGDSRRPVGNRWDDAAPNLGEVHAFLDDFNAPLPDRIGWQRVKAAHLGRVTLGIESGDREIRAGFGRTWDDSQLVTLVEDLKGVGISIGLVVLTGAGGRGSASRHVDATSSLLALLPLGPGDLVTLVDARSFDNDGPDPLSDEETSNQVVEWKRSAAARASNGPRLVAYNPNKRWN